MGQVLLSATNLPASCGFYCRPCIQAAHHCRYCLSGPANCIFPGKSGPIVHPICSENVQLL